MTEREYIQYHQKRLAVQSAQEPYIRALVEIYSVHVPTLVIRNGKIVSSSYPPDVQRQIDELHRMATDAAEWALKQFDFPAKPSAVKAAEEHKR
jgi:hypothetical protein